MLRILCLLLLALTGTLGEEQIHTVECPIPGNPDQADITETVCDSYTACKYSGGLCHMKKNNESGYIVSSLPINTGRGYKVIIDKIDPSVTLFNTDIQQLTVEVIYHESYHVQIKIYDANNSRYEIPYPLELPSTQSSILDYDVSTNDVGNPFLLSVTRISNGVNVLQSVGPLTFEDQFIQFTTALQSEYLYGIGENPHTRLKHSFDPRETYPIFARDQPVTSTDKVNQYGSHPYYVNIEDDDGNTHGVLLYNSNAMEYSTFLLGDGTPAITMRTIGGIIDFHVFMGPTPEDVNVQYANTVGKPILPPYWLFGFHLSRWGYGSTANYRVVRDRMKAAGIPQDGQTFDVDYMDGMRDFTYDPINFGDFPDLIQELHDDNLRVIAIFDPAVVADFDNYPPATRGKEKDVFIKWSNPENVPTDQPAGADQYIVGYVAPANKTVFPDFFKLETFEWWRDEIIAFHDTINFDGIWIDLNEPANFGTNLDRPFNMPPDQPDWSLKCPINNLDDPPYPTLAASGSLSESKRLSDKTICMATTQNDSMQTFSHYDVHSLYGLSETLATYEAMNALFPGQREVVLTRSTFPGSGKVSIHWLGDNSASWEQLQMSLIGIVEFSMFAIPMVGADVCGYFGEPTEELCIRWMQAGAFYPFDRNHNNNGTADQDPANPDWPNCPTISRDILLLRYKYIPYFYARFHRAHMNGFSVIRPLFNNFPTDLTARDIYDEFMWSNDLLVAPVVTEGAVTRDVYFPDSLWFDLVTGELAATGPVTLTVDAPLEKIPVYVRGGSILPWQEPAVTTTESRVNPFGITVALNPEQIASGEIFWDTGDIDHVMSESYIGELEFFFNELTLRGQYDISMVADLTIETIQIYGMTSTPTAVVINGLVQDDSSWSYENTSHVLVLTTSLPVSQNFDIFFNYA